MENYVIAELEIVTLASGDSVGVSSIVPGDNELPIDPANNAKGRNYTI